MLCSDDCPPKMSATRVRLFTEMLLEVGFDEAQLYSAGPASISTRRPWRMS